MRRRPLIRRTILLLVLCARPITAQQCVTTGLIAGPAYERNRLDQLQDSLALRPGEHMLRRSSTIAARCSGTAIEQLSIHPVGARANTLALYNSGYPQDRNTGAAWAGRGATSLIELGTEFRLGPVHVGLLPAVTYQENRDVAIAARGYAGYSPFVHSGHPTSIDLPQRFGTEDFWLLDPGQSYVRIAYSKAAIGVSTENVWVGPAQRTPILLSASAAGFPHAFISLDRGKAFGVYWSADLFLGRLEESDYFDGQADDDRALHGLTIIAEPDFVPGLAVGFGRMYASSMTNRSLLDGLTRAYGASGGATRSIDDNVLYALFARYVIPGAGAEVYAEWGHEDPFQSVGDLLREPDQTQGYVIGLQKRVAMGTRSLRVYGELTHLDASVSARSGRGITTYYTHGNLPQGHTQKGQSLGAWIGPGASIETAGVDYGDRRSNVGLYVEHIRFDADGYYNQWGKYYAWGGHDAQIGAGLIASYQYKSIFTALDANWAHRYNRSFLRLDGSIPGTFTNEKNLRLELSLSWRPMFGAAP